MLFLLTHVEEADTALRLWSTQFLAVFIDSFPVNE